MYQVNQLHRSRDVTMRMALSRAHIYAEVVDVVNLIPLIIQSGNTSPMWSTLWVCLGSHLTTWGALVAVW